MAAPQNDVGSVMSITSLSDGLRRTADAMDELGKSVEYAEDISRRLTGTTPPPNNPPGSKTPGASVEKPSIAEVAHKQGGAIEQLARRMNQLLSHINNSLT